MHVGIKEVGYNCSRFNIQYLGNMVRFTDRKKYLLFWLFLSVVLVITVAPLITISLTDIRGLVFENRYDGLFDVWSSGWAVLGSSSAIYFGGAVLFLFIATGAFTLHGSLQNRSREVKNGVLGDAKLLQSKKDLQRTNDTWNGIVKPKNANLVLGYADGSFYYDRMTTHAVIVATTGSGKSRIIALPTIDLVSAYGGNLIITDLKGELQEFTCDELEARGYQIFSLNLTAPLQGNRYNPLELVLHYADPINGKTKNIAKAVQAATELAEIIIPDENNNSSRIWTDAPRGILIGVILYICLNPDIPRNQKHLLSVARTINAGSMGVDTDPCEKLKNIFRELPYGHPAQDAFSAFLSSQGSEESGIMSTLKTNLRLFSDPNVAWLCAASDIDLFEIIENKTAVFLRINPSGGAYNKLLAVFLAQYYQAADSAKSFHGGRLPHETFVIGDEWGTIPKIESFKGAIAIARSMGLHYFIFVQMLSQLRDTYGEQGMNTIIGNCSIKAALKLASIEDASYFSKEIGDKTVRTEGTSSQRRDNGFGSSSKSYSETARQLIKPEEWSEFSPLRDGIIVIRSADNNTPERSGKYRFPCAEVTQTPTRKNFGLGTPAHERTKQKEYQVRLHKREELNRTNMEQVSVWIPSFEVSVEMVNDMKVAKTDSGAWAFLDGDSSEK